MLCKGQPERRKDEEGLPAPKQLRSNLDIAQRKVYLQQSVIKWLAQYGGYYTGTVSKYDAQRDIYTIVYAAFVEEDMLFEEVKSLVLKNVQGGRSKEAGVGDSQDGRGDDSYDCRAGARRGTWFRAAHAGNDSACSEDDL